MVKAYWWRGVPNFGDAIAPLLIKHFSGIDVEWGSVFEAKIASIGSILEHLSSSWEGYILGSGKLKETSRLSFDRAKILSLRGPLSAQGIAGNYTLGDPGLLADELVGPQEKIWDLGILPHWRDKELVPRFLKLVRTGEVKVIDPQGDPIITIKQIGSCKRIVTSSLHGMIVADAFGGIPRRVEMSPALAKEGGNFKFRDYSASLGLPLEFGKMTEPLRWKVEDVKYSVFDAYKVLEKELRGAR